ncbi:hypothetical protein AM571_PC00594 (plasmid) [Rhizobium etli 8C-3]|uniref:Uncharacterized protein n=1 Tax=Rhizobium etli 8C-3 TaxID=538025 RepID=A0A1L5PDY0_RHIET|nr:hypothetical protein AM571_PC00594 [Rhizobium etli 8C-3]
MAPIQGAWLTGHEVVKQRLARPHIQAVEVNRPVFDKRFAGRQRLLMTRSRHFSSAKRAATHEILSVARKAVGI